MPRALPRLPLSACRPQVWSLMNLAYAAHEIISDYATASFLWFESGCAMDSLQAPYAAGS